MTGQAWPSRLAAGAALLVGLLLAAISVAVGNETAQLRSEATNAEAAAKAVPEVAFVLRSAMNDAEAAVGEGPPVSIPAALDQGIPLDSAVRARDTAAPVIAETGDVLVARYGGGDSPGDVSARRSSFTGLEISPLSLESTLTRIGPTEGGIVLKGATQVVATSSGSPPAGATSNTVELSATLAPDWTVTVWSPAASTPLAAWLVGLGAALSGGIIGLFVLRRAARVQRARREVERLRAQSVTLNSLSSVAQSSLDLADVLPAVVTQLSDALGLVGLQITAPTQNGERALFTSGLRPAAQSAAGHPSTIASGESGTILLSRGGRTVARLSFVAGRDLDAIDVTTLGRVAEVLTAAIANAEAFSQQRELLERLREVDELKTVFLATASHELRTPVGIVTGFARLLAEKVDSLTPAQIATYAERVAANADQLATLVENLLDFSRLERDIHPGGQLEAIDLGVTVDVILDRHHDLAPHHTVHRRTSAGTRVLGREHAVERVLTNLVGNAAKYSPVGTTITVRVSTHEGHAELVVDDEGPGVPPQDRDQVFSRFFRGAGDAVLNTRGAGLGLAIVAEFASFMGGQVSVGDAPTGGARFVVSYPLSPSEGSDPGVHAQMSGGDADVQT